MTTSSKFDPARLSALKVIADEKLALSRASFEAYREIAESLQAQRRAIEQAEADIADAYPSLRPFFQSKLTEARAQAERLAAERDAALARSEAAAEASQTAGRLYQACRDYAVESRLIPDPQTGAVRKLEVVA